MLLDKTIIIDADELPWIRAKLAWPPAGSWVLAKHKDGRVKPTFCYTDKKLIPASIVEWLPFEWLEA